MKRILSVLCAVLLALSLTACGGKESPSSQLEGEPSSAGEVIPKPSAEPGEPASEPEPEPLPDLKPGRVLADIDDRLIPAEEVKGTQADLDRWEKAVRDPAVAWLEYTELGETERELSVETEEQLLTMFREARLRLYGPEEQLPNPYTGGAWTILAYDGEGNLLFYTHFMGNQFQLRLAGEETAYVFDGENILPSTLPVPEPPWVPDEGGEWAPDPQQVLAEQLESMQEYLEENLDPWDYSDIWRFIGIGEGHIEIATPTPDAVRPVVEAYSGESFPVEYTYVPFSKGQMQQAREDAERFAEGHPEIGLLGIRAQLGVSGGWIINVEKENSALTEFVKSYSIADIYQVVVGVTEFPD